MRSKAFTSFLLLATLVGLTAQGAEPAPRSIQLRFVALGEPIIGAGIAESDGLATPLVITSDSLSAPVTHRTGRLRLVSTQITPKRTKAATPIRAEDAAPQSPGLRKDRGVETIRKVKAGDREIGWSELPSGEHQRYIILVHPGKGSGLTCIPDRLGSFPPGSDRYINLTALPAIIDIPSGRKTLAPNGSIVLRPGPAHLHQYQLRVSAKSGGEEKLFFSAFTAQDDGRRNLVIFLPGGAQKDGIEVKSVSDGLAAEDNYR
jgi:hypothetical protein